MKILKGIILFVLCISALTGCTKDSSNESSNKDTVTTATPTAEQVATSDQAAVTPTNETAEVKEVKEKININIAALKGPTAMGMVKVMEDAAGNLTTNNYNFTIAGAADEISVGLVKGDIDIAAVPCNLASVLYNKTKGKIKVAGINTLGVLYIVETGDTIKSVADLKGKTIYSTGFGTTPQYTLNYLLTSYGIDPEKDVTIEYKTEPTEVAAMLSEATDAVAMLPQPYVTTVMMNNDKVRIALNVADEWDAVSKDGSSVVTGVIVVRSDFLENNKEEFEAFMEEYSASVRFVNDSVDEASALVEKFDIFKAVAAKKAIPYCNITLIQGNEMKEKISGYLTTLWNQNPESVGGNLPADDFYYIP